MRNASMEDVARAKATGKLEENVMYSWGSPWEKRSLVHGKKFDPYLEVALSYNPDFEHKLITICEDAFGIVHTCDLEFIHPVEKKGPAQQPKKPRRKPVKGTKPETKIPMSDDVKLEVGDVVLLDNGGRGVVKEADTDACGRYANSVFIDAGKYNHEPEINTRGVWFYDKTFKSNVGHVFITHKIIPYQDPVKEEKTPEQKAFEKGYWVSSNGKFPVFTSEVITEVLFSHGETSKNATGDEWAWGGQADDKYSIVAYRKAK